MNAPTTAARALAQAQAATTEAGSKLGLALAAYQEHEASLVWARGAAAIAANVFSSVLIISVNKALMGSGGYDFGFVVTLNDYHMTRVTFKRVRAEDRGGGDEAEAGGLNPIKSTMPPPLQLSKTSPRRAP